jgi:curved DNA-binding protein CbpA
VAPTAPHEEIKRAFRVQIARYHPDKVQHLGQEFQAMAAERAAELTEAYRILSDSGQRAEYDRTRESAPPPSAPGHAPSAPDERPSQPEVPQPTPGGSAAASHSSSAQFKLERAKRDTFVRKAAVGRCRQALDAMGGYDEREEAGFDAAFAPKPKMFGRGKGARLLVRFVGSVDADSVGSTWASAERTTGSGADEVCVLLIGSAIDPPRDLANAIAGLRRKSARTRGRIVLIPIDARSWDAHMPMDAPAVAKTLLERLRSGS